MIHKNLVVDPQVNTLIIICCSDFLFAPLYVGHIDILPSRYIKEPLSSRKGAAYIAWNVWLIIEHGNCVFAYAKTAYDIKSFVMHFIFLVDRR